MVKVQIFYPVARPTIYLPGDIVKGHVVVESDSVITTRSIYISFTGIESATIEDTSYAALPNGSGGVSVVPVVNTTTKTNTFLNKGKTLLGVGWAKRNNAPILQLAPGSHKFPFEFQLPLPTEKDEKGFPKVLHPSCNERWADTRASITYTLKASLDLANSLKTKILSTIATVSSEASFITQVPVGGHSVLPEEIEATSKAKIQAGAKKEFMFQTGQLSVSAKLDRKLHFTPLKTVLVTGVGVMNLAVTINNLSQKAVKGVRVQLLQTVRVDGTKNCQTRNWNFPYRVVENSSSTPRPEVVDFKLKVPSDLIPSTRAKYISVCHSIRVELVVDAFFAKNLVTLVPVTIVAPDEKIAKMLSPNAQVHNAMKNPAAAKPVIASETTIVATTNNLTIPNKQSLSPTTKDSVVRSSIPTTAVVVPTKTAPIVSSVATPVANKPNSPVSTVKDNKHKSKVIVWMPDSAVADCCVCKTEFTFTNRRHHCRMCGRVVCGDCSPKTSLEQLGATPERVCKSCCDASAAASPTATSAIVVPTKTNSEGYVLL